MRAMPALHAAQSASVVQPHAVEQGRVHDQYTPVDSTMAGQGCVCMHIAGPLTMLHGVQYYVYEANSLGATNGPHTVTAVTTKVRRWCVRVIASAPDDVDG